MSTITLHLNNEEERIFNEFAKYKGEELSYLLKSALLEKIHQESFQNSIQHYEKRKDEDLVLMSHEDFWKAVEREENTMELLIVIIAVVLVAVIALAFRTKPNAGGAVEQTPSTQESTPVEEAYIPEELEEYLRELKRNGQPIKAIQKLRNVTGMSLSEAKQFVDDIII